MSENENAVSSRFLLGASFLDFTLKVMSAKNDDIDLDKLKEEFDEDVHKEREGAYNKTITYVPAKHYRERLNEAFGHKWSSLVISKDVIRDQQYRRYNKDDEEYEWLDGTPYVEILLMIIVPGLGVHTAYGVKKIQGDTESDAIKAATTDALKKCCENFGIMVDYEDDDDVPSSGGGGKGTATAVDIDSLEFDEDELEEANEVEVTFGKYKGQTLEDIIDDDAEYVEWLYQKANEQDMRNAAAIVYKNHLDQEAEKKSSKKKGKADKGKSSKSEKASSSKSSKSDKSEKASSKSSKSTKEEKPSKSSKADKGKASKTKDEDSDDEKDELIETIEEIFEENEDTYDEVTRQSLIASVSISKKYPQGKSELSVLSVNELRKLAEVLADELEDDDDEDEEDED